jgi:hypothetical protein
VDNILQTFANYCLVRFADDGDKRVELRELDIVTKKGWLEENGISVCQREKRLCDK